MAQKQRTKTKKMSKASIPTMNNDVFKNNCVKVKPVLKPDVDVVEPVVKLKPDRRGPVEQGGCLGGDSKHVPRGPVEQGEFLGQEGLQKWGAVKITFVTLEKGSLRYLGFDAYIKDRNNYVFNFEEVSLSQIEKQNIVMGTIKMMAKVRTLSIQGRYPNLLSR